MHGARQILHFLIAGADAEQHAGKFFFLAVTLEQIGHLAAQEKVFQCAGAFQFLAEVFEFQT